VLPRGLPVGVAVKGLDGRWRVVLASDRAAVDFVRILLFEDFTQLVNQDALAPTVVPPPTRGAQTVGVVPQTPGAQPGAAATPGAGQPVATPPAGLSPTPKTTASPSSAAIPPAKTTPASPAPTPKAAPSTPAPKAPGPKAPGPKAPAPKAAAPKTAPAAGGSPP
jgi:rod shape-determining protein MreC